MSTRLRMPAHVKTGFEIFIQIVIFYSLALYFVEVEFTDGDHSTGFWLWSERIVATIFTIEYFIRWRASGSWRYPFRPLAVLDLLAILPFYIGFLVDLRTLRMIRTLRTLRVLKTARYVEAFRRLGNALHRVRHECGILSLAVLLTVFLSSVAIHELEREAQPEAFRRLSDAIWYVVVTLTTVGYGDKVPITGPGRVVAIATMLVGLAIFGTFISLIGSAFVEEIRESIARLGRDVELELALVRCAGSQQRPREAVVATAIREYLAKVGFLPPSNGNSS